MDEDLAIIAENTKKQQILNFFVKNKKKIYFFLCSLLLIIFIIFLYLDNVKNRKVEIADKFIKNALSYNVENKSYFAKQFKEIINTGDKTYAPLALFFLLDNKVIDSNTEINGLFDHLINNVKLENEIKNLILYKKALVNFDVKSEAEIIALLKPIINSESFWKPHSLLLLGDFFLNKGEKQKAKDFYSQILISKKNNKNIFNQAQLRIKQNYD